MLLLIKFLTDWDTCEIEDPQLDTVTRLMLAAFIKHCGLVKYFSLDRRYIIIIIIIIIIIYLTTNFFTRNIVKTKHVTIILKTTTYYKNTNTSTSISNYLFI